MVTCTHGILKFIAEAQERLHQLDAKLAASTLNGLAASTTKNLKTHILTYVRFCTLFNFPLFPATVLQIRRYLQYLSDQHESVESSKAYVGGVKSLHLLLNITPPNLDDYVYQLTVQGIRREKGHMTKQAAPMTPELLTHIYELVDFTDPRQVSSYIALVIGFLTLFRKSNLVADSDVKFDPVKTLSRGNFIRLKDCYLCRVYWSKTNQFGDRCLDIPLVANPDGRLCPVRLLDWYFGMVPGRAEDPAFMYYWRGKRQALSYQVLTKWLRAWIEALNRDPAQFSSHSLRRGGAQWAARCGIPAHVIKMLGDWKSDAYLRYLDLTLQDKYDAMLTFTMSMM